MPTATWSGSGVSAISHIGDSFSQNPRDLPSWQVALDEGRLPVFRGMRLDEDDVLRADLIQQLMCQGEIRYRGLERRYDIDFDAYFADALAKLQTAGGGRPGAVERERITVTRAGGCCCVTSRCASTATLDQRPAAAPRFSRAI